MINKTSASLKARKVLFFSFHHFSFYEQLKFYNLVPDSATIKNKYLKWNLKKFCWVIQPLCTNFQGLFKKTIYMLFKHLWTVNYNKELVLEKDLKVLSGDSTSVNQFSRTSKYLRKPSTLKNSK